MNPDPNVNPLAWAFWYLGEIAFKWVPGAVVATVGTAPATDTPIPPPTTISDPITPVQVVQYLQTASGPGGYDATFNSWSAFVAFSLLVTLCLTALIVYCCIRMFQIRQGERRKFAAMQQTVASHDVPKTQLRWARVLEEANSPDERTWRLAVLEADIMLNELLDSLGYRGETMADKMRAADRATFHTLDMAWEAHTFRNRIAHQSNQQPLDQREVRRVISLYERVFREFRFIE